MSNYWSIFLIFFAIIHLDAASPPHLSNPFRSLGFDTANEKGLSGDNQTICMIEPASALSATILPIEFEQKKLKKKIVLFDASKTVEALPEFSDISTSRLPKNSADEIRKYFQIQLSKLEKPPSEASFRSHIVQTTFLGAIGCAPNSYVHAFHIDNFYSNLLNHSNFDITGSYLTYMQLFHLAVESRKLMWAYDIVGSYHSPEKLARIIEETKEEINELTKTYPELYSYLHKQPINDSVLQAILAAAKTPRAIINGSLHLAQLMNPFNGFSIPISALARIGTALKNSDSLLILAAVNVLSGHILSKENFDAGFNSLISHPAIASRLFIVVNVEEHPKNLPFSEGKQQSLIIRLPDSKKHLVRVASCSNNSAGQPWDTSSICALGTNIIFPDGSHSTGTSLAAPLVTGLCALAREKYPEKSGPEIIELIKANAIPLSIPGTGHGLINPIATLGLSSKSACNIM